MESKVCESCKKELPLSCFYFRKEQGKYRPACKKCKSVKTVKQLQEERALNVKKCKTCGEIKPKSEFQNAGGGKWLQPYCKPCDKKRKEIHRLENIERYKNNHKEYYEKNKKLVDPVQKEINIKKSIEKLIEYNKANRKPKMPEEERKRRKRDCDRVYRIKNAEKIKEKKKEYYKGRGLEQSREWQKRMMSNIEFRIKKNLRGRVYVALKRGVKSASTMELLGCTIEEFKSYFESKFTDGMTWERYMAGEIHIDHIVPCIFFNLTEKEQQKKCFHYTNLQPLWAIDNLKKGTSLEYKTA